MTDGAGGPEDHERADEERVVDLRQALDEAGHEVDDLGWAEVPDSAPIHAERRDGENGDQIRREVEEMGSD